MFININPKFSQLKYYVCFTMLQKFGQNHPYIHSLHKSQKKSNLYQIIIKCIRKSQQDIQFKSKHQLYP
jgi:hypothetical protein